MATPAQSAYLNGRFDSRKDEIMFARFLRRRARRYIWSPAVNFSQRHLMVSLMEFGH